MSDYEDRLERIVSSGWATDDDIRWLISEVRRMRSEQSDHTAAKYWREIQALRRENHDFRDRLKRASGIAFKASEQPNDYDEDTEAEIALGKKILETLRGVS